VSVPQEESRGGSRGAEGASTPVAMGFADLARSDAAGSGGAGRSADSVRGGAAGSPSAGGPADPGGGGAATAGGAAGPATPVGSWRGRRLGLPESGPGSLAPAGHRLGAFVADIALSALVAGLFTAPQLPRNWSLLAFVAEYVVFGAVFAQTPGMRLLGLRLVRLDRPARVGPVRVVARTAMLVLLVPALIWDIDGRGVHDRMTRTAVIRT
jgi:hypothetical protein